MLFTCACFWYICVCDITLWWHDWLLSSLQFNKQSEIELSDSLDSCWEPNDSDLWLHVNHRTSVCQTIRVWHRPSDVTVPSHFGVTFGSSTHSQQERKFYHEIRTRTCGHANMHICRYTPTCISNNCHRFCNDLTCLTANWNKPMSFKKAYLKKINK